MILIIYDIIKQKNNIYLMIWGEDNMNTVIKEIIDKKEKEQISAVSLLVAFNTIKPATSLSA
mgnify:CR=1 FL=1